MLTVFIGFHLAVHLMTAQCVKENLTQTLVPNDYSARVVIVKWEWAAPQSAS